MIEVEIASKSFGRIEVLRDVRFAVAPGDVLAILGPSGIGKSSLLRIAARIDRDFRGEIGRPERAAMVFQEPVLMPWRTVAENLSLVHPALGRDGTLAALDRVGIADKAEQFPRQLSLGQQRRVALARAMAGAPEALFMDEPFVSLDPGTVEEMLTLTERLIAEVRPATLFVTHSEAEARRLATHILRLAGRPATLCVS